MWAPVEALDLSALSFALQHLRNMQVFFARVWCLSNLIWLGHIWGCNRSEIWCLPKQWSHTLRFTTLWSHSTTSTLRSGPKLGHPSKFSRISEFCGFWRGQIIETASEPAFPAPPSPSPSSCHGPAVTLHGPVVPWDAGPLEKQPGGTQTNHNLPLKWNPPLSKRGFYMFSSADRIATKTQFLLLWLDPQRGPAQIETKLFDSTWKLLECSTPRDEPNEPQCIVASCITR